MRVSVEDVGWGSILGNEKGKIKMEFEWGRLGRADTFSARQGRLVVHGRITQGANSTTAFTHFTITGPDGRIVDGTMKSIAPCDRATILQMISHLAFRTEVQRMNEALGFADVHHRPEPVL